MTIRTHLACLYAKTKEKNCVYHIKKWVKDESRQHQICFSRLPIIYPYRLAVLHSKTLNKEQRHLRYIKKQIYKHKEKSN